MPMQFFPCGLDVVKWKLVVIPFMTVTKPVQRFEPFLSMFGSEKAPKGLHLVSSLPLPAQIGRGFSGSRLELPICGH
eukprot:4313299-Amphidinium_carterae.1